MNRGIRISCHCFEPRSLPYSNKTRAASISSSQISWNVILLCFDKADLLIVDTGHHLLVLGPVAVGESGLSDIVKKPGSERVLDIEVNLGLAGSFDRHIGIVHGSHYLSGNGWDGW